MASDDAAFITGQAIVVDGGSYRIGLAVVIFCRVAFLLALSDIRQQSHG
ncbi:hypothetical protein [Collimonas sp. OK607]